MKFKVFIILFLVFAMDSFAQVENDTIDYKYLEDQLYLSFTYNILMHRPDTDFDSPFSLGVALGFIKDIPLNKRRNAGIGIGLGYAFNSYKNKITLFDDPGDGTGIVEEYLTERINTNSVELPFEIRWRTSTATDYNFWRIYGGIKFSYMFYTKAKFKYNDESVTFKNMDLLNNFQYGATLSAGYGTWNVYGYYGLSRLFNGVDSTGNDLQVTDFNIGLKFYIL